MIFPRVSPPGGAQDVTRRVADMYSRFPYPSRDRKEHRLTELANLLRLFAVETGFDFRGKSVLDVGTGTGHRLIAAAQVFRETKFTAVDLCEEPLEIARSTAAAAGVTNITFHHHDLMADAIGRGRFDIVLCMGVLHHLADPRLGVERLANCVADDGVLFTYVYGLLGSAERMRRKEMLALLLGSNRGDFDAGIRMAHSLGFSPKQFGWGRNADDEASADTLIVDSYLNVHENLFDLERVSKLMKFSALDSLMPFGITTEARGYLFDSDLHARSPLMVQWTDMKKHLPTAGAVASYERLSLAERCRLVELAYQPNGYTLMAWRGGAGRFAAGGRIHRNTLSL